MRGDGSFPGIGSARSIDIWVNCPDRAVAARIAEALVAGRLVACANILPPIDSVYRWKGSVERAEEVPLLLKSRAALFEEICGRIASLHPYEVPSIVAVPLVAVSPDYAAWLEAETRPPAASPGPSG